MAYLDFIESIPPNIWMADDSLSELDGTSDFTNVLHIEPVFPKKLAWLTLVLP